MFLSTNYGNKIQILHKRQCIAYISTHYTDTLYSNTHARARVHTHTHTHNLIVAIATIKLPIAIIVLTVKLYSVIPLAASSSKTLLKYIESG